MSRKKIFNLAVKAISQTPHYTIPNNVRELSFIGKSANGLVKATLWGSGKLEQLEFDNSLKEQDTQILESLVMEAYTDARQKVS